MGAFSPITHLICGVSLVIPFLFFQRSLAEAEEELARQRREMAASFSMQAQQLELKYRQQAEDAQQVWSLWT